MTVAAARRVGHRDVTEAGVDAACPTAASAPTTAAPAFATVAVARSIDEAARAWDALTPVSLATPYQGRAFLAAWADAIAPEEGATPMVVIARDADGTPVALLPLCVRRRFGVAVARFMGGSHVNYNAPVIRRDRLVAFDSDGCLRLLREAAAIAGVDAYALSNQPLVWEGEANPFAALPSQPSPDPAFSGPLAASLDDHLKLFVSAKSRSNQRRKMRRFEELGTPRIYCATTEAERRRLLDAYFAQKARQFDERGVANVFGRPGVRAFIDAACGLSGAKPTIDLYGFDLDGETIAVTGGLADHQRYCGMFISITSGEKAKYSPGEMLMNFVVEQAIGRGLKTFDLGVGAAAYKKMYCPNRETLVDSVIGVTARGRLAATLVSAGTALKARLKASPAARRWIDRARSLRARPRSAPDAAEAE